MRTQRLTDDRLHPAFVAGVGVREGVMGERHTCEPERWPADLDDHWSCSSCGQDYFAFDVSKNWHGLPESAVVRGALGWAALGADPGNLSDAGGRVEP